MSTASGKLMKHIIDQATFDEAVKENVEVLEMKPMEAISEAKAQFISQNVNISNIITDAFLYDGLDNHPFVKCFKLCKELLTEKYLSGEELRVTLNDLIHEMEKDSAKKLYIGNNGGYTMAMTFLRDSATKAQSGQQQYYIDFEEGNELMIVNFLKRVLDGYPDLLDARDLPLILGLLEKYVARKPGYASNVLICHVLDLITSTLILHENNRELWSASPLLLDLLATLPSRGDYNVLQCTLKLLRAMAQDDDVRVEVANTHERVRKFADVFLPDLTQLLEKTGKLSDAPRESPQKQCETMSLLLKTLSSLVVRNEHCSVVVDNGGVGAVMRMTKTLLSPALEDNKITHQNMELGVALMGFVKTIVGNDDVKNAVAESGLVEIIVALVNVVRDRSSADRLDCTVLYETYLLLLSTLSLRHTEMCSKLLDHNVLETVVLLIKEHPNNVKMVKYGSWTVHNICARQKQSVETVLGIGGDKVLQAALQSHPSIGYDIKNALKELGDTVDVKLEEQWTGKGQLNFKPEY